ncbi:MAG TPA: hypothetical protein VGO03_12660 [Acidimicrobiia bacterium]|jgi:hypothetical protein
MIGSTEPSEAAIWARKTWRTLEPIHGMIYFAPEAATRYEALGLHDRSGYFASRSAPMGAVPATVVIATFYNFEPKLVHESMHGVWARATPAQLLDARLAAADAALRRALPGGWDAQHMQSAAELARHAAEAACEHPEGRPLFAGHADLPWPDEPHLALWHAQTLLREFRGDGHIAELSTRGISGIEALVLHAATGEVPRAALQATRRWDDASWNATVDALVARGWLQPDGSFTDEGRRVRDEIEAGTDRLARLPYEAIGEDGCAQLRGLCRPWSKAIVSGGLIGFDNQS